MIRRLSCFIFAMAIPPLFSQTGDVEKGKFSIESSGCLTCHRIEEKGSRTGRNLSEIGDKRNTERLRLAIVEPDAEVLRENRYVDVVLKDGTTVKGRILNHDAMSVQLIDAKENLRSFQTSAIRGYRILTKGLMPSYFRQIVGRPSVRYRRVPEFAEGNRSALTRGANTPCALHERCLSLLVARGIAAGTDHL